MRRLQAGRPGGALTIETWNRHRGATGSWALPESLAAIIRRANSAKVLKSMTPAKLYVYDTLLKRLAQDLEDMAAELREFIQAEHTVVRE
jgi:hypothetical protein